MKSKLSLYSWFSVPDWEDKWYLFDIKLINIADFTELVLRFMFTIAVIFIIVNYMYAKHSNRKDYYFTFFSVGLTVFLLSFLLNSVKLELGFALGLFAIFGIIRYRTYTVPIKEMTYMFVVIGIAVINALANKKISYAELFLTNGVIITGVWLLERYLLLRAEHAVDMIYEKIENIHSSNKEQLLEDLRRRTGIDIHRYKVNKIDFLKDTAELTVYYYENDKIK